MAAFARLASGDSDPVRILEGSKSKITRASHGVAYDPARDEIITSAPMAMAIVVFPGGASGEVPPLRVIQGSKTHLRTPFQVTVDDLHKELLTVDISGNAILAFPLDANGNVPPLRMIKGHKTGLLRPSGVAVDPDRGLIVAAGAYGQHDRHGQGALFVFNRTDNGDVSPRAVIMGPHTGIISPWHVALYKGKIFATASNADYVPPYGEGGYEPRPGCTGPPPPWAGPLGFVGVWKISDNGDVPPEAIIRGPTSELVHPSGIAINPATGEIYASDSVRNGLISFVVPEFFNR